MEELDKVATKRDIVELAEGMERMEERLIESMRTMQTELLRGVEGLIGGMTLRMRKLEADQSNLDASVSGRVEILERRLFEIEKRLAIQPPEVPPIS